MFLSFVFRSGVTSRRLPEHYNRNDSNQSLKQQGLQSWGLGWAGAVIFTVTKAKDTMLKMRKQFQLNY